MRRCRDTSQRSRISRNLGVALAFVDPVAELHAVYDCLENRRRHTRVRSELASKRIDEIENGFLHIFLLSLLSFDVKALRNVCTTSNQLLRMLSMRQH